MEQIADIEITVFEKMRLESRQAELAEGREEGLEVGCEERREEGELLGKRLLLRRLLTHRFGDLPQDTVQRIELIHKDALFDSLVEQALTATTINELGLPALPASENAGSA